MRPLSRSWWLTRPFAWRGRDRRRPPLGLTRLLIGIAARAGALLAVLAMRSHAPSGEPAFLKVEIGGCEMIRAPAERADAGLSCELWGPSFYAPLRGTADGVVTLWMRTSSGDEPVVSIDGEWAGRPSRWVGVIPAPSGQEERRMQVTVKKGARELVVSAGLGARRRVVRQVLVTAEDSDDQRVLRDAMKTYREGDRKAARDRAEPLRASASDAVKARALGLLARIAAFDRAPGWPDLFEQAIAADRRAGLASSAVLDTLNEAFQVMYRLDDPVRAVAILDDLDRSGAVDEIPEGRALAPYFRAVPTKDAGDFGEARRLLAESEEAATRLDLRGHLEYVYDQQIQLLDRLGIQGDEMSEGVRKMESVAPRADQPLRFAEYEQNLGCHQLAAAGTGASHDTERRAADVHFERAERVLGPGGTWKDGCLLRNVRTSRAGVALDLAESTGDARYIDDAEHLLARALEADCGIPKASYVVEQTLFEGRLALLRGKLEDAGRRFSAARTLSQAAVRPDYEIEATLGLAEVAERTGGEGAVALALTLYQQVEERLSRWSAMIPFGTGRQSFLNRYHDGLRQYLDLLLRQAEQGPLDREDHDARHLACVARRGLARHLSMAEWTYRSARHWTDWSKVRGDYERSRDELVSKIEQPVRGDAPTREKQLSDLAKQGADLASTLDGKAVRLAGAPPASQCEGDTAGPSPVAEDEVLLIYHPVRNDVWMGLALTRSHAVLQRIRLSSAELEGLPRAIPETLSSRLLAPLEEILVEEGGGKRSLRVFASAPLGALDLQELTFEGARLGERFSVTYGVDVPPAGSRSVTSGRALIVIPNLDIATAATNAETIKSTLERAGWKVDVLPGERATRANVLGALKQGDVALLHFYGHGRAEGQDAWASRLVLHEDVLSIFDVLALDRAPRLVVLGDCEPAATVGASDAQGLAMAHAFLLAGAEHVLGSPRKIDAADTDDVLRELYESHWPALLGDPAPAVQETLLALRPRPYLKGVTLPMLHVFAR